MAHWKITFVVDTDRDGAVQLSTRMLHCMDAAHQVYAGVTDELTPIDIHDVDQYRAWLDSIPADENGVKHWGAP